MKLQDSLTIMYLPFEIAEGVEQQTLFDDSPNWVKCTKVSIDGDYLYPYVSQFMCGANLAADHVQIYELKQGACCSFNNNNTYTFSLKKQKQEYSYRFKFCAGKKLNAPHVIIYPHCPVGILVMGVELQGDDLTLDDLKMFNYALHKIDHQQPYLQVEKKDVAAKLYGSPEGEGIRLSDLCKLLLSDTVVPQISFLEKIRMHLFSYVQVTEVGDMDDFRDALLQIASIQTEAYQTARSTSQPVELFRNIHVCSRSEGCVMATILEPECDTPFIRNYKSGKFVMEYLWIYTFVIMQYYALIRQTNQLYRPLGYRDVSETIGQLWQIRKHIFICVSRFTNINRFYRTVVENIGLQALLDMLNENYNNMQDSFQVQISTRTNWILAFLTFSQVIFAIFSFFSVNVEYNQPLVRMVGIMWSAGCFFIFVWFIWKTYFTDRRRGNRHK